MRDDSTNKTCCTIRETYPTVVSEVGDIYKRKCGWGNGVRIEIYRKIMWGFWKKDNKKGWGVYIHQQ